MSEKPGTIPDGAVAGRVAIVTGANTGIGYRAAELLAQAGAEVILACRSEERGREAENRIRKACPEAKVQFMPLDLNELRSVKEFADTFLSTNKPLHYLILNAGIMKPTGKRLETKDGFEEHMGVNHVGHFLLAGLLLNKVKQSGTPDNKARIVIVASMAHKGIGPGRRPLNFDDIHLERERYNGSQAYKNSKLANVMMTKKLSRLLQNENVVVNCMCPGMIPGTDLGRYITGCARCCFSCIACFCFPCFRAASRTVDHGGRMIVMLATDPKLENVSGEYFTDFRQKPASPEARDESKQERLWQATLDMLSSKLPGLTLQY